MDRRSWTQQEDQAIVSLVDEFGVMDWTNISQKLKERYSINERTGKQCRERWYNHLNPQVNKKPWTDEEEKLLFEIHRKSGNKWKLMSRYFEGRTDNDIKNHFYSTLRRSLRRLNKFIGEKNSTTQMREIKPSVLSTIMNYIYGQENSIETNIVNSLKDLPYLIFEFSNYKPVKSQVKVQEDEQMKGKINFIFTLITKANNTYQVLKQNSKAVKNSRKCNSNNNSSGCGIKNTNNFVNGNNNNNYNNSNSNNYNNNISNNNFKNCQMINYNSLQQQIHTAVQIAAPQEKSSSTTNTHKSSSTTNTTNTHKSSIYNADTNNKSSIYNADTNNQCRNNNNNITKSFDTIKQQDNKINQQQKPQQQQLLDFIKYLPKKSNSPINLSIQLNTTPIKKIKQKTVKILKKPDYSFNQFNNNNNNNTNNKMDTQYLQRDSILIDNNNTNDMINNTNDMINNSNKDPHTELIQGDNNMMHLQLLQQSQHSDFFTKRDYYQSEYNLSNTKQQLIQSTQNLQQLTYLRTRRISLEAYEDFMEDQDIGELQQPSQVEFYYPTGSLDDLVVVGKQVVIHQIQQQQNSVLIGNNQQVKVEQHQSDDHSNIDELIEMNYSHSH